MFGTLGPKLSTVFASRWRALWFAASVLLLAYCSVPSPEQTEADNAAKKAAQHEQHMRENPWALDTAK